MPIYDYECPHCGFTEEILHGFHDTPKPGCWDCKALMRKKIGTGVQIRWKQGIYTVPSKRRTENLQLDPNKGEKYLEFCRQRTRENQAKLHQERVADWKKKGLVKK